MTPIREVIGSVVEALRSIPDLLELMGGDPDTGIYPQSQDEQARDLSESIDSMLTPALMVVWDGIVAAQLGSVTRIGHQISLLIRLETPAQYHAAVAAILDGVPASTGQDLPFLTCDLHPDLVMNGVPTFGRLIDGNGTEMWQMTLPPLMEAGG